MRARRRCGCGWKYYIRRQRGWSSSRKQPRFGAREDLLPGRAAALPAVFALVDHRCGAGSAARPGDERAEFAGIGEAEKPEERFGK